MKNLKMNNIECNQKTIFELEIAMNEAKNVRMYKRYFVMLITFNVFKIIVYTQ